MIQRVHALGVFMLVWSHTGFLQTGIYSSKLCHSIVQLSFSPVSIHISVLICSYFCLFVSDRSVREICIYEKRGKIVLEIARTKHVRKHEQFSVCDRCIHVLINVLEIARTNHVRKHRSIPGIFNLLSQISTCFHKCPGDRKDKSYLYT